MKDSFALILLFIILFFSCCKNKDECKKTCRCDYGTIRFSLADKDSPQNSYFDTRPNLNSDNVTMYDEKGNYATYYGLSWEGLKNSSSLSSSITFDFHSEKEPFGQDKTKLFYLHLDKDIDTIRVEYKIKNECLHLDYLKAFYNNKLLVTSGSTTVPILTGDIFYK